MSVGFGQFCAAIWEFAVAINACAGQLLQRLPVTFELGFLALIVGLLIALPVGIYSAVRQDTPGDMLARSFSILMLAVPSFWMGTMVMVFPSIWWGWSPEDELCKLSEDPLQNLKQMIIPQSCWEWNCAQ